MSGGGPVMDSGFHYCDSLRYLLGEVDRVYAEARAIGSGVPCGLSESREDTVIATFSFRSGVVGSWSWSQAARGLPASNITFYCSEGSITDISSNPFRIFHLFERRGEQPPDRENARIVNSEGREISLQELEDLHLEAIDDSEREFLFPGGISDGFAYEIWEFLECIRGNRDRPEVDGWEGLRSLAVCEAVYESAYSGEAVHVDEVISGDCCAYQEAVNEHWGLV